MFVPVPFVGGVKMPVVEIVDMVSVRHGDVSTVGSVDVIVPGVDHALVQGALVPMVVVSMMEMSVVDVVHMALVLHGGVSAIGTMDMRVTRMSAVHAGRRRFVTHGFSVSQHLGRKLLEFVGSAHSFRSHGEDVGIDVCSPLGRTSDQVHDLPEIGAVSDTPGHGYDDRSSRSRSDEHQDG